MASAIGEPMFRIIEDGEIELDAEIVETELKNVKVDQKAVVTVAGLRRLRRQGAAGLAGSRQDDATGPRENLPWRQPGPAHRFVRARAH